MCEFIRCADIRVALAGALAVTALAGYGLVSMARKGELPKAEQKAAQQLGGLERLQDLKEYIMCDTLNYCDKGGHKERSRKNQPQHDDWWRRQK